MDGTGHDDPVDNKRLREDTPSDASDSTTPSSVSKPSRKRRRRTAIVQALRRTLSRQDQDSDSDEMSHEQFPSHAMQQFLKNFPGGELSFLGLGLGGGGSRMNHLVEGLQSPDETEQMKALGELCHNLSMATEDSMPGFRFDAFIGPLIKCMQIEHNNEIMLLACRALAHLMEAFPPATGSVVNGGAVPVLVEKILSMQFIDLAEQALHCLEKIVTEHPSAVLKENGMAAMLQYFDFFNLTLQRKVLSTVANMCRRVPPLLFKNVENCIPQLTLLLSYEDAKLVEYTCLIFSRLVQNFTDNEEILEVIGSSTLIGCLLQLLSKKDGQLPSTNTYTLVLRTLALLTRASVPITANTLSVGAMDQLLDIFRQTDSCSGLDITPREDGGLPGTPAPNHPSASPGTPTIPVGMSPTSPISPQPAQSSASRRLLTAETIQEVVCLYDAFLPRLSSGLLHDLETKRRECPAQSGGKVEQGDEDEEEDDDGSEVSGHGYRLRRPTHAVGPMYLAHTPSDNPVKQKEREKMYQEHPEYLSLIASGLPHVMDILRNSVQQNIKQRCLSAIATVIHFAPPDILRDTLRTLPISSFIAHIVHSGDLTAMATGLHIAEVLMEKLPDVFRTYFIREGVVTEVLNLSTSPYKPPPAEGKPGTAKAIAEHHDLQAIKEFSRRFHQKYFENIKDGNPEAHPVVRQLRTLARRFENWKSTSDEEQSQMLQELCDLLAAEEGISTYEFATTGIINGLVSYLRDEDDKGVESQLSRALRVFRYLARPMPPVTAPRKLVSPLSPHGGQHATSFEEGTSFLHAVVHKLVAALHQTERLPVYVTELGNNMSTAGLSCGLKLLTEPFRLSLVCDSQKGGTPVKDTVVRIEPLATIGAVEEFIVSKLMHRDAEDDMEASSDLEEAVRHSTQHPHPLAYAASHAGGWTCDSCQVNKCGPGSGRWRCNGCDFDLCNTCMAASVKEGTPTKPRSANSSSSKKSRGEKDESSESKRDRKSSLLAWPLRRRARKSDEASSQSSGTHASDDTPARDAPERGSSSKDDKDKDKEKDKEKEQPVIVMELNGHRLPSSLSIFQAIHQYSDWRSQLPEANSSSFEMVHTTHAMWDPVYQLHYRFVKSGEDSPAAEEPKVPPSNEVKIIPQLPGLNEGCVTYLQACRSVLTSPNDFSASLGETTKSILELLGLIYSLNSTAGQILEWKRNDEGLEHFSEDMRLQRVGDTEFRSLKLTNKVLRQVLDGVLLCTGHLSSSWCQPLIVDCQFLFSFSTRMTFFELSSFGPTRSMLRLQEIMQEQGETKLKLGRVQKQKIRLARDDVLESAKKIMDVYGSQKSFLEFEYYMEAGTGLGPTMEFYTLVSRALQLRSHGMWHTEEAPHTLESDDDNEYVYAPQGLFPRPVAPSDPKHDQIVAMFKFLGQFLMRALYDRRIVDLPMSIPLLKLIRGDPLQQADLHHINKPLAMILDQLASLSCQRDKILEKHGCSLAAPTEAAKKEIEALQYTPPEIPGKKPQVSCRVEDLCLDFTLNGYPDIKLRGDGEEDVTIWNLHDYVALSVEWILRRGIADQMAALWRGADQIFPIKQLRIFTPGELDQMLCGSVEPLTISALEAATVCDHGYTHSSRAVRLLFEVISNFTPGETREFIAFVTGAPRLPVGGIKALRPRLTIVRKTNDGGAPASDTLPSVMTCQNYLKLPDYDSIEVMGAKLKQAMQEGAESFHLS